MKTSRMIAMALTVALASQMMVPVAFGAEADEAMEGLHLVETTEDVVGDGYEFVYAEGGSTFTVTGDMFIQDTYGIVLPADATLVVEEDASLTIYAETYGIYADGDMDMVLDGDLNIVVDMEGGTMEDPMYAIVSAGTYDGEGGYIGDGKLTVTSSGDSEIIAKDGIYGSGGIDITGGTWDISAYSALHCNTSDITLENCEIYMSGDFAIYAGGTVTIGEGCVIDCDGTITGGDFSISETSDINAMVGYVTVDVEEVERPWTVKVYGDAMFSFGSGESEFFNDYIVFEEGATLTITEDAIFNLAPSEDKEGDLGSTIDATGGTIINNGIMIFKAGTTEEEIEAMDIQGDGAIGVMSEEDLLSMPYTDVSPSNWFYDAVFFVTGFGFMEGVSETEFAPTEAMTRGMLMDSMYHVSGAYMEEGADGDAVAWAMEAGISDGTNPENPVTRQEMVSILYRAIGSPVGEGDLSAFVDGDDISDYAVDAMVWAVEAGLVSGNPDGTLGARDGATRAQMAQILLKLVQLMYGM